MFNFQIPSTVPQTTVPVQYTYVWHTQILQRDNIYDIIFHTHSMNNHSHQISAGEHHHHIFIYSIDELTLFYLRIPPQSYLSSTYICTYIRVRVDSQQDISSLYRYITYVLSILLVYSYAPLAFVIR